MRILGLDVGTHCGWAIREPDGSMISGVWDLSVKRHESAGMRLIRLRGHLTTIHTSTPFVLLAYEEVRRHAGTNAAHVYGAIEGVIQAWCIDRLYPDPGEINHVGIPVGTIKKFATGKGNANKLAMVDAACDKWPEFGAVGMLDDLDDNEADARWIAECAASQFGEQQ